MLPLRLSLQPCRTAGLGSSSHLPCLVPSSVPRSCLGYFAFEYQREMIWGYPQTSQDPWPPEVRLLSNVYPSIPWAGRTPELCRQLRDVCCGWQWAKAPGPAASSGLCSNVLLPHRVKKRGQPLEPQRPPGGGSFMGTVPGYAQKCPLELKSNPDA